MNCLQILRGQILPRIWSQGKIKCVICQINEASEKTILANGGVYEKTIDVDDCKMKRYWITV